MATQLLDELDAHLKGEQELSEMKEMIRQLLAQSKGKGKQSDSTPERSVVVAERGDGSGNQPLPPQQGVRWDPGGGGSDDDREGSRKERGDERPAGQSEKPRREEDVEDEDDEGMVDPDELRFFHILGKAIRDTSKRPAQLLGVTYTVTYGNRLDLKLRWFVDGVV